MRMYCSMYGVEYVSSDYEQVVFMFKKNIFYIFTRGELITLDLEAPLDVFLQPLI